MKRLIAIEEILQAYPLLMLCLPLSLSLSSCGGGTKGTGGYDVNGRIYDYTGTAISGANITAEDADGQKIVAALSDTTGFFALNDISDEGLLVNVEKDGRPLGRISVTLTSANQSADLELRERHDAEGCVDSVLKTDSEAQATTRITVWGNLAPYNGIIHRSPKLRSPRILPTTADEGELPIRIEPTSVDDLTTQTGSDFMAVLVVRDAAGKEHDIFLNFVRHNEHEFAARVYALGSELENVDPRSSRFVALGRGVTLRFNQDGTRIDPVGPFDNDDLLRATWKGVEGESAIGLNLSNFTGLEAPFNIQCINTEQ